ncbi:MAG: NosD domain-containing protein [Candidatus Bathyarchaeia archaeon]
MAAKKKRKSWKEQLKQIQLKQQRLEKEYIEQGKIAKRKPRKLPVGKIIVVLCAVLLVLGFYGLLQFAQTIEYHEDELQHTIQTPPPSESSGIMYITPQGEVFPSDAPLVRVGDNKYALTADTRDTIKIYKDNIVIDGNNHTIQGADELGSIGIDLIGRSNVTIKNIRIEGFENGIYLSASSNNVISQNEITNNYYGIYMGVSSNNNEISRNKITNSQMVAVWVINASGNKISENTITSNDYGIIVKYSKNVIIFKNYIANNNMSVYLYEASNNRIYYNSFINNYEHASCYNSTNSWDYGYPTGGNYWSDYTKKYPVAKELESSGLWDTPYRIDDKNQDRYPLIEPMVK